MSARPRPSADAALEARRLVRAQSRVVDARIATWAERTDDRDALHDARTALRRLRVLVRSFRSDLGPLARRRVRRRLREAFRATSPLRDADVFVAWLDTLPSSRAVRHLVGVSAADGSDRAPRVSEQMRASWRVAHRRLRSARQRQPDRRRASRPFGSAAARAVRAEVRVVDAGLARFDPVRSAADVHRTRIAVKRLRYLIEALTGRSSDATRVVAWCRMFQDLAGEWRDATLASTLVRACPPLEGRAVVISRLASRRRYARARLRQFVADAGAWQVARRDALAIARRYALVPRPSDSVHESRSAAPAWPGARSENIGDI